MVYISCIHVYVRLNVAVFYNILHNEINSQFKKYNEIINSIRNYKPISISAGLLKLWELQEAGTIEQ